MFLIFHPGVLIDLQHANVLTTALSKDHYLGRVDCIVIKCRAILLFCKIIKCLLPLVEKKVPSAQFSLMTQKVLLGP